MATCNTTPPRFPLSLKNSTRASTSLAGGAPIEKILGSHVACRAALRIGQWQNYLESHCMTLAPPLKHTAERSFKTSLFMGSYIVSSPLWQHGQGRASQKFPCQTHRVNTGNRITEFPERFAFFSISLSPTFG